MSAPCDYRDGVADNSIGPMAFSNRLGCLHILMPYSHLKHDPWDYLLTGRRYLKNQPDTTSTWVWKEIPGMATYRAMSGRRHDYAKLLGGWAMDKVNNNRTYRYVNPHYQHVDKLNWTPLEDRGTHWDSLAQFGVFSSRKAAARYDASKSSVLRHFERNGKSWKECRDMGREMVCNAVKCSVEWTDRTQKECAEALGIHEMRLSDWLRRYTTVDVPPRPCETQRADGWG